MQRTSPGFRRGALALSLAGAFWSAGCAAPGLLPVRESSGGLTSQALREAQKSYLYADRLDERMMIGALDALETRFDSVRFDAEEGAAFGVLTVGEAEARVRIEPEIDPDRFEQVLGGALAFAEQHLGEEAEEDGDSDQVRDQRGAEQARHEQRHPGRDGERAEVPLRSAEPVETVSGGEHEPGSAVTPCAKS